MKKLCGNLFLKIIAFVLVCVAAPVLGMNIVFTFGTYNSGIYAEETSYEDSSICLNFVNSSLAEVRERIYWHDISGFAGDEFFSEHENFAVVIKDSAGKTVYSSLRSGFTLIVENYPAREVDESGNVLSEYTMDGYIAETISERDDGAEEYERFLFYKEYRYTFLQVMAVSFIICTILCAYLIAASGADENGEVSLKGINAVDYDITLGLCVFGFVLLGQNLGYVFRNFDASIFSFAEMLLIFAGLTVVVLVAMMSTAAHFKTKHWWKHTFIYQLAAVFIKFIRWFMRNIGIGWKIAAAVTGYSLVIFLLGVLTWDAYDGAVFILIAIFVTVAAASAAIWFGSQLKKIKRGGEAIANGDFDYRINSKELWPMLRSHAWNLNCAALGMSKAVEDRLKSERFKTELITNVSHDLKTPLTSIVSYVDLLKKENIENETAKGYIEVIDRQSAKLRKLTEDLVEASKATSGAVAVNKEVLNIGELINQSVGEFSEKLLSAEITPVINLPEKDVYVCTDGRLLWRVFDNLIQNIIKYAQVGTRAYFDLSAGETDAVLTIRNISREPLNMTAEALMERFVRGDASRNSEGNGLGLSIAKSLTELCGGKFELMLDGDLYKVTITFSLSEGPGEENR